jgi:probable HAF family extracellular repeat protein
VVWSGGTVQDLGTLGGSWSAAYAISDSGKVAGTSETATGSFEAFTTSGGALKSLGTLGGPSSQGFAINNAGEVAGAAQTAGGYYHAFTWSGMSLLDLGTLGGTQSYAYGLNNDGDVVGYSYTAQGERHAFLYSNGVMLDLNNLLPILGGWTITDAFAINDAGFIAGAALVDGIYHAIELNPGAGIVTATPEPLWTISVGLALIFAGMLYRRRSARNEKARVLNYLHQIKAQRAAMGRDISPMSFTQADQSAG